jgi:hypothetical protein
MADRYRRLADYYAGRGSLAKASRMSRKAAWHFHKGGGNDSPVAVAMAMPVPGLRLADAVSDREVSGDDVA